MISEPNYIIRRDNVVTCQSGGAEHNMCNEIIQVSGASGL
jgi:hypothetical protein